MIRASGSISLGGSQFKLPAAHAAELATIPGVRAATPIGQTFDKSDSGFGQRLIDGIEYDEYANLARITIREGRKLESGDEAIVDPEWKDRRKVKVGDTVELFERPFKIVGVYEPPGGGRIKIPLKTMQEQEGAENRASAILIANFASSPAAAQNQPDLGCRQAFARRSSEEIPVLFQTPGP